MTELTTECERIELSCESTEREPAWGAGDGASGWDVTLCRSNGATLTVRFTMGAAHTDEPNAIDVLECLLSEADVRGYDRFEDWADDMGADSDSREAERTYNGCRQQTAKLETFLGDDLDVFLDAER